MSVNKVILVGNVGKDPEVRYLEKDVAVANFSLATTEKGYTMQNGTQVPERTEWHNIVAWRALATVAEKYIKKGSQIYVEGKIQTRTYEKDGIKRFFTEIYAENIMLLGKKPESGEPLVNTGAASVPDTQVPPPAEDDLPF
ncbi:MAG: single-stranded DNA-binding protein [Paludibacter sp.]|nr:single-stranded DNA-binding protein [Paludibacter sp.]